MLDHFSSKLAVFAGLFGAAGLAWGVLTGETIGRGSIFDLLESSDGTISGWALLAWLVLCCLGFWLAAWAVVKDLRKAASSMHALHFVLLPYFIPGSILVFFSGRARWSFALFCVAYGLMVLAPPFLEIRRRRRMEKSSWQASNLKSMLGPIAVVVLCTVGLYAAMAVLSAPSSTSKLYLSGGAWPTFAWAFVGFGDVDLGLWVLEAVLAGGITGMWAGFLAAATSDSWSHGRGIYAGAALGLLFGAVASGLTFGGQAVQHVHLYDVGLNQQLASKAALLIWGVCGGIIGLLVAGMVHGVAGEKSERLRRLANGLAFGAVPVLLASWWSLGFIQKKDVGRHLFVEAERLEGHASWIGLGTIDQDEPRSRRGNLVIRITSAGPEQSKERDSYWQTIRMCENLMERYPHSAYRSAALYLKSWCEAYDWRPQDALATWNVLQREYPGNFFGHGTSSSVLTRNYALLGDYKKVLSLARLERQDSPDHHPSSVAIRAAEIEGDWDQAIRFYQDRETYIHRSAERTTRRDRKEIEHCQEKIAELEVSRARGVAPAPRTDVSGSVHAAGRPARNVPVCIVPAGRIDAAERRVQVSDVARAGGLVGITDDQGRYHIPAAPSGSYELLIVLNPERFPSGRYHVKAEGIPFSASGKTVAVPAVELFSLEGTAPSRR